MEGKVLRMTKSSRAGLGVGLPGERKQTSLTTCEKVSLPIIDLHMRSTGQDPQRGLRVQGLQLCASCVTPDKSENISGPQFPIVK